MRGSAGRRVVRVGAALLALAAHALARDAAACSCVPGGYGADHWDLVFEGTVEAVGVDGDVALTRFRVDRFWKGHLGAFVDVSHPFDGASVGNCGVHFDPGTTHRLGVNRRSGTCNGTINLCARLSEDIDWEALASGALPASGPGPLDGDGGEVCVADAGADDAFLGAHGWDGGAEAPDGAAGTATGGAGGSPFPFGGGGSTPVADAAGDLPGDRSTPESRSDGACACRLARPGRSAHPALVLTGAFLGGVALRRSRRPGASRDGTPAGRGRSSPRAAAGLRPERRGWDHGQLGEG